MMTYKELREDMLKLEKFPECEKRARAPLIHEGFPGTFNLSFTEYDYLREFGNLSNFNKDFIFSTIQSCVRPSDIIEKIGVGRDLWKYLGVFEMADISGAVILSNQRKADEIHIKNIRATINLLGKLGVDIKKVYPSYCIGGSVSEITLGKYNFDFTIPRDRISEDVFKSLGIPGENLIPDRSRDTFLALQIAGMKTPWGYRNEINYNLGTKTEPLFLDIGTLERCSWFPTYNGEEKASNITGLEDMPHTFAISAVGLERLHMAINDIKSVVNVDYIKEFYETYRTVSINLTEEQRYKAGEVIRAMHRIQSDVKHYNLIWSESRKKKKRRIMRALKENHPTITDGELEQLLKVHAESQPWHENLQEGIEPAKRIILQFLEAKNK